ncbi:MAG: DegT/DnrJ/EryC1/StrS family aminotransferase [Candidatus Nanopelagicales bacterium]
MINVFGSAVGADEIAAVAEVMKSQWMGFGSPVESFEEKFRRERHLDDFAMVDSGSNALLMATTLLDLPPGSEVIVPSFTWVSCAQAVILAGCRPVFCDVDPATMNVTAEHIERRVTDRTAAVMVVHYAGLSVDLDPIRSLGYPIIEDAAHAVASTYKGKPCGGVGDVGIYSFDAVKNLAVGEGGGITALDPARMARARRLRYCGIGKSGFESAASSAKGTSRWWEVSVDEPFIKMLPTSISAAIGLVQLDRLGTLQDRRAKLWRMYDGLLGVEERIGLPVGESGFGEHSHFTYCIRVDRRDELARHLLDHDIYTTLRYPPMHLYPIYGQTDVRLPNCELLNETALNVPLHPRLTDADVERVCELIIDFVRS